MASYGVAAILVLLPFHALFTTWAGSSFGHLDLFRIWKEILMVPLGLFAVWLLCRNKELRSQLTASWLPRLVIIYTLLFLVFGVIALYVGRTNTDALLYSWITNLRFIWFLLVVWVVARADPFLTQEWLKILLVPAGLVVVFGLLQRFLLPADFLRHFGYGPDTIPAIQTIDNKLEYQRIQSTLRGANPLGAYLMMVMTAIIASLRRKRWLAIGLVATAVVFFFSYSRSAWIGLVVSLGVLGLLQLSSRRGRQLAVISLVAACLAGASTIWLFRHNDVLQNTIFHSDETSQATQSSNEVRSSALTTAVSEIAREPLGRGPGTAGPASVRNNQQPPRIAENYYLQIAQEIGLAGLALFLGIIILLVKELWHRRRYVLAQVLLASLAGIAVINLISHAWTDDTLSLLWWGLAGAALSLPAILSKELPKHHGSKKTPQKNPAS